MSFERLPLPKRYGPRDAGMTVLSTWLLLDFDEGLPKRLYQWGGQPDPFRLFDETELAGYSAQSPLLVRAEHNPRLLRAFNDEPDDWPGLLLVTPHPTALLLLHLRHILIIRFAGQRKGVLRYYSPRTASYFFSAQSGELATWFGPIQQLSWHGGTWRDEAEDTLGFHTMTNPEAPDWRPEANRQAFHIGSEHAEALQRQQAERFLYQWWSKNPVPSFNQAWNWLEEGRRFGLVSSEALNNYLDARCAHPDSNLPVDPPPTNEMERLEYLTTHLRQSVKDKERYS